MWRRHSLVRFSAFRQGIGKVANNKGIKLENKSKWSIFEEEPQIHILQAFVWLHLLIRNAQTCAPKAIQGLLVANYTCKFDVSWSLEELTLFEDLNS